MAELPRDPDELRRLRELLFDLISQLRRLSADCAAGHPSREDLYLLDRFDLVWKYLPPAERAQMCELARPPFEDGDGLAREASRANALAKLFRGLEDRVVSEIESLAGGEAAGDHQNLRSAAEPPDNNQEKGQHGSESPAIRVLLGEAGSAIIPIAENSELSVSEKMWRIAAIKTEATAWKSPDWGDLLDVTADWIRQQPPWKKWRQAEKKPDND